MLARSIGCWKAGSWLPFIATLPKQLYKSISLLLLSCRPLARQMSKTFALLPLGALDDDESLSGLSVLEGAFSVANPHKLPNTSPVQTYSCQPCEREKSGTPELFLPTMTSSAAGTPDP